MDSFQISGRGVAAVGRLSGVIEPSGLPAEIHFEGRVVPVGEAWVELMRSQKPERIALLLRGVRKEQVLIGSVVYPRLPE